MRTLHSYMHKSFVLCYKIAAAIILYGVLLAIGSYVFNLGFFAASSSWVVPFIATPSNDKILDMTGKLITSQQSLATLTLDRDRLDTSLGDMKTQKAALLRLDKELQAAISRESVHNEVSGAALAQLDAQKQDDNVKTRAILDDVQQVEDQINQELKAGLITKGDAATQRTAINQAKTSHTDSKIAEVLLRDSVLQKNTTGTQLLDVLSKQADLKSQEVQLDVLIETGEEQLVSDKQQIAFLQQALKIASISPYYLATQGDTQFAFVPYSNQSNMVVGAPVYGCYLSMIICHRVGTVERAFSEEETTMHPVFHTQLRGTLIQLNLTDVQAAKNSVLFLNHKPLLF